MSIIGRVRAAFLRRELTALLLADRTARDQVHTTADMMRDVVVRAARAVELRNRIAELEGTQEDEPPNSDFVPRTPSDMFVPSENKSGR